VQCKDLWQEVYKAKNSESVSAMRRRQCSERKIMRQAGPLAEDDYVVQGTRSEALRETGKLSTNDQWNE
jgi:hypothetical protein